MVKILHFEPTSRCNAACPMCARNVNGEGCIVSLADLDIRQFQLQIIKNINKKLEKIFFCGTVGDPCADISLLEKIKWVKDLHPGIVVGINTNGSIRNTNWWIDCANLLNGSLDYVVFSIDGLKDTNHIYRVGVQFDKVMQNAQAYIDSGGSAHWDMLVFDHNKHQIEKCKELAENMGFTWFRSKETDRWDEYSFNHIKPANKYNYIDYNNINSIICERNNEESTYIDYKGQEFPCCHIAESYYKGKTKHEDILQYTPEQLMDEYQTRLDNKNPFYVCKRSCGKNANKRSQWKQEIQLK